MPHFGLVDEEALGPEASELMRARLHIRSARLRLEEGLVHEGISTLFDALLSSLRWYVLSADRTAALDIRQGEDLNDEGVILEVLRRCGVVEPPFGLDDVWAVEERMIEGDLKGTDYSALAAEMESVMETLGVIPFDESELPPENPELRYPSR